MRTFSVKQLAGLAGVSIRTLHHYDRIGLLKPAHRSEKGYRYYGRMELFTLQQILEDARKQDEKINRQLASLMDMDPADAQVQQAIARHHQHVNLFHPFTNEAYRGLGKMYVEDERFRVHFEAYRPGLADFIRRGIAVFCDNDLQIK